MTTKTMLILGLIAGLGGSDIIIGQAFAQQPIKNNVQDQITDLDERVSSLERWQTAFSSYASNAITGLSDDVSNLQEQTYNLWIHVSEVRTEIFGYVLENRDSIIATNDRVTLNKNYLDNQAEEASLLRDRLNQEILDRTAGDQYVLGEIENQITNTYWALGDVDCPPGEHMIGMDYAVGLMVPICEPTPEIPDTSDFATQTEVLSLWDEVASIHSTDNNQNQRLSELDARLALLEGIDWHGYYTIADGVGIDLNCDNNPDTSVLAGTLVGFEIVHASSATDQFKLSYLVTQESGTVVNGNDIFTVNFEVGSVEPFDNYHLFVENEVDYDMVFKTTNGRPTIIGQMNLIDNWHCQLDTPQVIEFIQ